jgi:hypothetical protein
MTVPSCKETKAAAKVEKFESWMAKERGRTEPSLQDELDYNAQDVLATDRAHVHLMPMIKKEGLEDVLLWDRRMARVALEASWNGAPWDQDLASDIVKKAVHERDEALERLAERGGLSPGEIKLHVVHGSNHHEEGWQESRAAEEWLLQWLKDGV